MTGKAKVIESRVAYDGRIFQAVVERAQLPHRDQPSTVEIVRHAPSVVIAAMPAPDVVLLVKQYRHAIGETLWELPAGSVDDGESAEQAAKRECQEELGVIGGRFEPLGRFWPLPGYCTEEMHVFRVTELRQPGPDDPAAHQDEDESIEAQAFRLEEIQRMVRDGRVRDLKTVAALVLLER